MLAWLRSARSGTAEYVGAEVADQKEKQKEQQAVDQQSPETDGAERRFEPGPAPRERRRLGAPQAGEAAAPRRRIHASERRAGGMAGSDAADLSWRLAGWATIRRAVQGQGPQPLVCSVSQFGPPPPASGARRPTSPRRTRRLRGRQPPARLVTRAVSALARPRDLEQEGGSYPVRHKLVSVHNRRWMILPARTAKRGRAAKEAHRGETAALLPDPWDHWRATAP